MTTLENLWYGRIIPWETFVRNDPQLKCLLSHASRDYDKLTADFTETQKEMLEKYKDTICEINSYTEQAAFKYGFSLGVNLIIEANKNLTKNDI